jgi:outer membrane lipoprotein-sorting protein
MNHFKKITVTMLMLISILATANVMAIYDPETDAAQNPWQMNSVGQTAFNGIPVIVSLEEAPIDVTVAPNRGVRINSLLNPYGQLVVHQGDEKLYRLALRAANQSNLAVYFKLIQVTDANATPGMLRFVSDTKDSNGVLSFEISGQTGNTLTVNYLRYQENNVVESGSFELNPVIRTTTTTK